MINQSDIIYDAIIIGGGPGGVSAALYAARGGSKVLIVHNGLSALNRAKTVQNYYGTGEISGDKLYDTGLEQARSVGAETVKEQVTSVRFDGKVFTVVTAAAERTAHNVIIATGAAHKAADIEGLKEFEGRGVSYCAVCDGFFYKKKTVAVIGSGEYAEHEYNVLKNIAAKTYLLTNGEKAAFAADAVITDKIARIVGGEKVSGIEFVGGDPIAADGVFVAIGCLGSSEIAKSVGVLTDRQNNIIIDENCRTNVPGLYAVGDCTPGIKQVSKAVYDGMRAGLHIKKKS